MSTLEEYFSYYRDRMVGNNAYFSSPFGEKKIVYADWIASGRLYHPIEEQILNFFGPFVANTHTEANESGTRMTHAYRYAHDIIKKHVNANDDDIIITAGFGMTAVINKLQRILGFKGCGHLQKSHCLLKNKRPIVFISHMEHHSNQTSWYETYADVVIVPPDDNLQVSIENLYIMLEKYKDRTLKIGAFTACSNVTGIRTPIHKMARAMHEHGGICIVDFAASAPYDPIDMHPEDNLEKLDAILFSPHKFLGGPGSSGVLIFDKSLYASPAPDHPGGGTVDWTTPWGNYKYVDDIEAREDGGTPGFLQAIRGALAIKLKESMGLKQIRTRENELLKLAFDGLNKIPDLKILANNIQKRLGVISFYISGIHFNLIVRLLNDLYGIQVRGGCACAGTYGHYLLNVSQVRSKQITDKIDNGDLSVKPGWVRWSLHPTMKNQEIFEFIIALNYIIKHHQVLAKQYNYCSKKNEFTHISHIKVKTAIKEEWFEFKSHTVFKMFAAQ